MNLGPGSLYDPAAPWNEPQHHPRCPWCGAGHWYGTEPPPHESDCKRQAALTTAEGKETPQ